MKKFLTVLVIVLSFLLGNMSMLLGLIKLIGESAFSAMAKDGIVQWVMHLLYPEHGPERVPGSANPSFYGQTTRYEDGLNRRSSGD